jgi:hypothetical protein
MGLHHFSAPPVTFNQDPGQTWDPMTFREAL